MITCHVELYGRRFVVAGVTDCDGDDAALVLLDAIQESTSQLVKGIAFQRAAKRASPTRLLRASTTGSNVDYSGGFVAVDRTRMANARQILDARFHPYTSRWNRRPLQAKLDAIAAMRDLERACQLAGTGRVGWPIRWTSRTGAERIGPEWLEAWVASPQDGWA